jgi:hypothetical protein
VFTEEKQNDWIILGGNLTFDLEMTFDLEDDKGNSLRIRHKVPHSMAYESLFDKNYSFEAIDYSKIQEIIENNSLVNPLEEISELESACYQNRYLLTRVLLNALEKEQLIDAVENLHIEESSSNANSIPITNFIDPSPIAITENYLVFALKKPKQPILSIFPIFSNQVGTITLADGLTINVKFMWVYPGHLYIFSSSDKNYSYSYNLSITKKSFELLQTNETNNQETRLSGTVVGGDYKNFIELQAKIKSSLSKITISIINNEPSISTSDGIEYVIKEYIVNLRQWADNYKKDNANKVIDTVYLPTSGIFAEAILGRSNASEFIDIRRFYNWQDSPIPNSAPSIMPVDAVKDFAQKLSELNLNPTDIASILKLTEPQMFPMPTSLDNSLQAIQNGNMFRDMSKTEQFAGVLGQLMQLASTTANKAGDLSGEAGKNALNAAVELGKQVADMVNKAMDTNVAPSPKNPTEKGGAINVLDEISDNDKTKQEDVQPVEQAKANALGTPLPKKGAGKKGQGKNGTKKPNRNSNSDSPSGDQTLCKIKLLDPYGVSLNLDSLAPTCELTLESGSTDAQIAKGTHIIDNKLIKEFKAGYYSEINLLISFKDGSTYSGTKNTSIKKKDRVLNIDPTDKRFLKNMF